MVINNHSLMFLVMVWRLWNEILLVADISLQEKRSYREANCDTVFMASYPRLPLGNIQAVLVVDIVRPPV